MQCHKREMILLLRKQTLLRQLREKMVAKQNIQTNKKTHKVHDEKKQCKYIDLESKEKCHLVRNAKSVYCKDHQMEMQVQRRKAARKKRLATVLKKKQFSKPSSSLSVQMTTQITKFAAEIHPADLYSKHKNPNLQPKKVIPNVKRRINGSIVRESFRTTTS